jgi:hypothetical protein
MMNIYHYDTVSEAVNQLHKRGFEIDFNTVVSAKYHPDDFEIVEVHRYEGDSDPGDEAVVYALESKKGDKGILVSGFGASADSFATAVLSKLHFHGQ